MLEEWINFEPYELDSFSKKKLIMGELNLLTQFHYDHCESYARILRVQNLENKKFQSLSEIPFLPVRLFKQKKLQSIPENEIIKTMTSSGTTGQLVSKIYLDKTTSSLQTRVLTKIVTSFIGQTRLPMLILDSESSIKNRTQFSARGAGILGFSMFGIKPVFAFDDNMKFKEEVISDFLKKYEGNSILLFGFTFIVFSFFLKNLENINKKFDLSNGILIHGGGWKKLISESISKDEFKRRFYSISGLRRIHDYYGMVEQTGSIFMECEYGYLHASVYADILIRRNFDFSIAENGEIGLVQVFSLLPKSYPGHSLLTEDQGVIFGEDTCECGRLGKYFKILGRIKSAEIRGCSDTFEGRA